MRCPACQAENLDTATSCTACGANLTQSSPSVPVATVSAGEAEETQSSGRRGRTNSFPAAASKHKQGLAWTAFRCSVVAMIPVVGLLLGPIAFLLGFLAWWRGQVDPRDRGIGPALASMLLGGLTALTNWLGVALMIHGLWSEWGS